MKAILFTLIFMTTIVFSQENPWEYKPSTNPWEIEKTDTLEKDSTAIQLEKIDSSFSKKELRNNLNEVVKDRYKDMGGFILGVGSGAVLNFGGTLVAFVYTFSTSKKEKKLIEEIANDSTYASIDKEILRSESKKAIKDKKLTNSVGGSIVGVIIQYAVLFGIITSI